MKTKQLFKRLKALLAARPWIVAIPVVAVLALTAGFSQHKPSDHALQKLPTGQDHANIATEQAATGPLSSTVDPSSSPTDHPSQQTKTTPTSNRSTPPSKPQPSAPTLVFSSTHLTLPKLSATNGGGYAYLTITSNAGAFTQPVITNYKKTVPLETTATTPSAFIFRDQWQFRIGRIDNAYYGTDAMDFTAKTANGTTLTGHVDYTLEVIPSFTVTKGPLTKVHNPDGTVTYSANFTINPGPYFGNPQLHMCIMDYHFECQTNSFFTYDGNNNLSMSKTITPFPSGDIHAYFDIIVSIDGLYVSGNARMAWHEDY